jgi:hypothetical protein
VHIHKTEIKSYIKMGPISLNVSVHEAERFSRYEHSRLLGPFVSCKKK